MSNRPIQVGDIAMVVRGHSCTLTKWGGIPFRVARINPPPEGGWICNKCGMRGPNELAANRSGRALVGVPLSWLKRIDPPSQDESVTLDEEVTA